MTDRLGEGILGASQGLFLNLHCGDRGACFIIVFKSCILLYVLF